MKDEARTIIAGTIFILLFGVVSSAVINNSETAEGLPGGEGSWACTADTKICPDGSAVGRIPPYCQFTNCEN